MNLSSKTMESHVSTPPTEAVLTVQSLNVVLEKADQTAHVLKDVSFSVGRGRIVGLIGESGSGKSMTAKSVLRMLPEAARISSGSISLNGQDLLAMPASAMRNVRGAQMGAVFQDPLSSLNPVLRIGEQVIEAIRAHGAPAASARERAVALLQSVGIPNPQLRMTQYPHEFSGGMRQRVCIAMAIANNPSLLIADEPTTAVDVTVQAQILQTLNDLRDTLGLAVLLITHDMGVVSQTCDDVIVMYQGEVVEQGPAQTVLRAPQHAYTKALLAAAPSIDDPLLKREPVTKKPPILELDDISTTVGPTGGWLRKDRSVKAVDAVTLRIHPGETVGLVGESGSGKTTLARTAVGFISPSAGSVAVAGKTTAGSSRQEREDQRRIVQYVFQDPFASLDPKMTIRQSLDEALAFAGVPAPERKQRARELLNLVQLDHTFLDRLPKEFSGGQRQRVVIARALAVNPRLVVADEAVSALDVSVQAQVLTVLRTLQEETGIGMLFISHDLAVVRSISDRVAVMYLGRIVEVGPVADIYHSPQHPYTTVLLASSPSLKNNGRSQPKLLGETPSPNLAPSGCRFRNRCPIGPLVNTDRKICMEQDPQLAGDEAGHMAACHFPGELRMAYRQPTPA